MNPQVNLAVVIVISVLLYVAACNGAAYCRLHPQTRAVTWLQRSVFRPSHWGWLYHIARFVYYIGIPYAALRQGFASAQMMGLGAWNGKFEDVLIGFGLCTAAVVLFAVAWRARGRSTLYPAAQGSTPGQHWLTSALAILYLEIHWAFYRSGPILWLGGDYYTGSVLGLVLIWVEGLASPAVRAELRRPETSMHVAIDWGTSLCMTAVFYFARSLWIVIPAHWLVAACDDGFRRAIDSRRLPPADASTRDDH